MRFATMFDRESFVGLDTGSESLVEQSHRDECNINSIISKYQRTGILGNPLEERRQMVYGDFTQVKDFQSAQNAIVQAREAFESLPANLRERFGNDPAKLLAFLSDDRNDPEAIALGLKTPPAPQDGIFAPDPAQNRAPDPSPVNPANAGESPTAVSPDLPIS